MTQTMVSALPTWRTSRYTVVELPQEIDMSNAGGLCEYLFSELQPGASGVPIIVDLTGTAFCDCSAINALVRARARARAAGRRLYAAVPPAGLVRKVFESSAITRLIPVYEDVGSAIAMAVVTALDDADDASAGADDTPAGEPP